jgi:hypothetical protein
MNFFYRSLALAVLLTGTPALAAGAQSAEADSVRAQIQQTLRAFYFNLGHGDWEALTAAILAAKVVAHRPAPEALVASGYAGGSCVSTSQAPDVDRGMIALDGDWAEVSVPRCGAAPAGADEFRLIHFEERWRFVYIDLFEEPVNVSTDR